MSDRGSPSDHAATDTPQPGIDAPASASPQDTGQPDGTDAKSPADTSSLSDQPGATKLDEPKPTLLEVLKTAAALPDPDGKSPTPAKTGKDNADPAAAAPDKDAKPEQDDSKLSFHNHPRWQEVVAQNKQYREQVRGLEPDADQYRKIHGFMEEHRLTPGEVGEGFILMAMMKNGDPRAIQKLDDYRNKIALALGETLPPDIQEKIDIGEISEDAGKELAKARATAAITERQLADRDAADRNAERARSVQALADSQAKAVTAWDLETRKLDPDFPRKEKAIERYTRALIQEHGPPPTAEDAVKLIKAAYAQVNRDFATALPKRPAVARVPIAPSSNGARPAPKTLREVVEQAANMS